MSIERPSLTGGERCARPEMAGDDLGRAGELGGAPGGVGVREAVKAVAAQVPALSPGCVERVGRGGGREERCGQLSQRGHDLVVDPHGPR